jgi:hypothetical protein
MAICQGILSIQHIKGLLRHMWRAITFCLAIDDVGIKVTDMADFHHLKTSLKEYYEITVDWTALLFCGVKRTWDYKQRHVDCSMPGYIDKALKMYQHPMPMAPQDAPYAAAPIQYGDKVQQVDIGTTSLLLPTELKLVQDIVGTLPYYTRAVNPTLLAAFSAIAA